jgi:hypothetical protein
MAVAATWKVTYGRPDIGKLPPRAWNPKSEENLVMGQRVPTGKQAVKLEEDLRVAAVEGQLVNRAVDLDEDCVARCNDRTTKVAARVDDHSALVTGAWNPKSEENLVMGQRVPTGKQAVKLDEHPRISTMRSCRGLLRLFKK